MEELITLKQLLHEGKVTEALELVEELAEMGKSDKVNKIFSYGTILLLHLIKQSAEKRTTRSWDISIQNAVKQIQRTNQRYRAKGTYLSEEELAETLQDAYGLALGRAALEAFEGRYEAEDLGKMVEQAQILGTAMRLIVSKE
jgi:hypothetical protein